MNAATEHREAVAWCDKVNALPKRHLHAAPRELFAAEKPRLVPLPLWVPDVYARARARTRALHPDEAWVTCRSKSVHLGR